MTRSTRLLVMLGALAVVLLGVPARAEAAGAVNGGAEADYVARINAVRASVGARPLTVDGNLTSLARQHTQEMIAAGGLFHAPDLSVGVTTSWTKLGENVGMGSSTDLVWNAFLNSAAHYRNITDPAFDRIGVGVIDDGGLQWSTQRYLQSAAAPAPTPAPAPAPTSAAPRPAATAPRPPATAAPRPVTPVTTAPPVTAPPTTEAPPPPAPEPVPAPPADPGRVDALLTALSALR